MCAVYVVGHKNPDTDSIVSAMAYASLRNALGDREYVAARLGEVSDETQMVLDRFGFSAPPLLHTLRTQVSDLNFDTPPVLGSAVSIYHAWKIIGDSATSALPVADEDGKLYGMLTYSDIAGYDLGTIDLKHVQDVPVFNLLNALDGTLRNAAGRRDLLSGELVIALPNAPDMERTITENTVLICGQQPEYIRKAIDAHAAGIILCEAEIEDSLCRNAGDTCIISTPYDAYRASRMIFQAVPVARICKCGNIIGFHLDDYVDEVQDIMLQTRHRSYPVMDAQERVVGTISRYHLLRPTRKRVVLVDHNEVAQSVHGLQQAEILEIIDHHRLADVQTEAPIYMRNEPVGSTATIITGLFQERGVMPSSKMAALLASAILSDTVMFKSPTCTQTDKIAAERMARIARISLEELGHDIFAVASAPDRSAKDLLFTDFKEFHIAGHSIGIGQLTCIDHTNLHVKEDELMACMQETMNENKYDMLLMMLTDVLREGTELLILGNTQIIEQAFHVDVKNNRAFLPGVMSRKKQIVPMLSLLWG